MRVELSRKAETDLDHIRDFSVERFGYDRAIAYLDGVEDVFRRIARFPEIGVISANLRGTSRSISAGEHRVFYVHDVERVLILRILHKRMDVKRELDL